jgi:hypothetical protein
MKVTGLSTSILMLKDGVRGAESVEQSALQRNVAFDASSVQVLDIRDMEVDCGYCGDLSLQGESGRCIHNCCPGQKVKLCPLIEYPIHLRELLCTVNEDSSHFYKNIIIYNHAFAFASVNTANVDLRARESRPVLVRFEVFTAVVMKSSVF